MDDHDQIILAITGDISHDGFSRFGKLARATAKTFLLEHLPSVRRHELVLRVKNHQIKIVSGRLEKDEVLATVVRQVAGNDVAEETIFDWRLVTIQCGEFPNVACQREPRDGIEAKKRHAVGFRFAKRLRWGDCFLREVMEKGEVLYEADDA